MRMRNRGVAALLSMALMVNMVSLTAAAEEIDGNLTIVSEDADAGGDLENAGDGLEDAGDDLENPGDGLENVSDDLKDEGESGDQEDAGKAQEPEESEKTGGITHSITMKSIEEPQPQAEEQPDESRARDIRNEKVEVTGYDAQKGTFRVVVSNVSDAEQAKKVVLPVWSAVNGQDDIVWYEGRSKGNGEWSVIVNSSNHRHSGTYITHIYTDGAFAGSMSYQLKKNGIEIADIIRNAGKPAGKTLYVWGGGWNEADTAAGETARTIGVYPEWERYFGSNRQGYSYLPGKRAWERGERQWRFYGLDWRYHQHIRALLLKPWTVQRRKRPHSSQHPERRRTGERHRNRRQIVGSLKACKLLHAAELSPVVGKLRW